MTLTDNDDHVPEIGVRCEICGNTFLASRNTVSGEWEMKGVTKCPHVYDILDALGGEFAEALDSQNTKGNATDILH